MFGFLLGIPALRLSGPYLAIATLAVGLALPQVLKLEWIRDWTGGTHGLLLTAPRAPSAVSGFMTDRQWVYFSCVVPALMLTVMAWNIVHGPVGRAFVALREAEVGAQQMGVNVSLYKRLAFGLSAFYAGIGGGLFVFTEAFMSPDTFDLNMSITMLVMVVIGGLASTSGTVVAAAVMTFRNHIIDGFASMGILDIPGMLVPGREQSSDTLRGAVYGVSLILTVMYMPQGIAGFAERIGRRLTAKEVQGGASNEPLPDAAAAVSRGGTTK